MPTAPRVGTPGAPYRVSLHFPSREARAPATMACSPVLSSTLARTTLGRCAPRRRVTAPHQSLHRYAAQRTFSMSPSVQHRNAEGSSKPVVLLMDEIKLADELLSDLSKKWEVVVSSSLSLPLPISREGPAVQRFQTYYNLLLCSRPSANLTEIDVSAGHSRSRLQPEAASSMIAVPSTRMPRESTVTLRAPRPRCENCYALVFRGRLAD